MSDSFPEFKYHPDPLTTGAIEASGATCIVCGRARGYIYTGPIYSEREEYLDVLDADGSPTAYLFRCLHCGKIGGYSDCH